ncbi:MAG: hypothetical protein KDA71_09095 [Planctomycetales bacterium]|nr:hypothetical protein [Planctomycetales bacterium]
MTSEIPESSDSSKAESDSPAIAQCGFCGQGHLHIWRCENCSAIVAICDECELIWNDTVAVYRDPTIASDASYPRCPQCQAENGAWQRVR